MGNPDRPDNVGASSGPGQGPDSASFFTTMRDRMNTVSTAESSMRVKMLLDMRTEWDADNLWPDGSKSERQSDGRPALSLNRIKQFVNQNTNTQRSSRMAIQVNPVTKDAKKDVAEALQDVCRSIENNSDADVAYTTAGRHQVICGRGYFRIFPEYMEDDGFDMWPTFHRILNPLTVFMDVAHRRADASDARYCFVIEDIPKPEFRAKYGDAVASDFDLWCLSPGNNAPDWMPEGRVRVAEYFYKEEQEEKLYLVNIPDQTKPGKFKEVKMYFDELPTDYEMDEAGWEIVDERTVTKSVVKWAKVTGSQILEGNDELTEGRDFPCKYIPVVQVIGDESDINGETDLKGMVRDMIEPARMYTFWASGFTEQIAVLPRAPYLGVAGQFKGHEDKWNTANRKNYGYLEYNNVSFGGQSIGPPQRQQFDASIQAMVEVFQLADNDIKAIAGMYDASLGKSGPEQSGKAVLARQRQSEVGNSQYLDNLSRSIRFAGRILIDMVPRVMPPVKVLKVIGIDDQKMRDIVLHQGANPDDIAMFEAANGVQDIYDISVGRYDVFISTGPSYASRRQEAVDAMLKLIEVMPQAAPVIADLLVGSMDWPVASQVAARLKSMVPPQAMASENGGQPPPTAEQMKQVQARLEEAMKKLENKTAEKEFDLRIAEIKAASDAQVAIIKANTEAWKVEAKISADRTQLMLEHGLSDMNAQLSMIREIALNNKPVVPSGAQPASPSAAEAIPAPAAPVQQAGA